MITRLKADDVNGFNTWCFRKYIVNFSVFLYVVVLQSCLTAYSFQKQIS